MVTTTQDPACDGGRTSCRCKPGAKTWWFTNSNGCRRCTCKLVVPTTTTSAPTSSTPRKPSPVVEVSQTPSNPVPTALPTTVPHLEMTVTTTGANMASTTAPTATAGTGPTSANGVRCGSRIPKCVCTDASLRVVLELDSRGCNSCGCELINPPLFGAEGGGDGNGDIAGSDGASLTELYSIVIPAGIAGLLVLLCIVLLLVHRRRSWRRDAMQGTGVTAARNRKWSYARPLEPVASRVSFGAPNITWDPLTNTWTTSPAPQTGIEKNESLQVAPQVAGAPPKRRVTVFKRPSQDNIGFTLNNSQSYGMVPDAEAMLHLAHPYSGNTPSPSPSPPSLFRFFPISRAMGKWSGTSRRYCAAPTPFWRNIPLPQGSQDITHQLPFMLLSGFQHGYHHRCQ